MDDFQVRFSSQILMISPKTHIFNKITRNGNVCLIDIRKK